jgi:8-amino-7-oxononanoate synthase
MDGDLGPLPELARAARASKAWLIVDDAHGLGVLGPNGRGSCEHFALNAGDVPVLIGTFGKAFGTFGAFVAGDADLIDFLIQKSRTYIYTTALPAAVAAATRAALRVSARETWRREKVLALARRFQRGLIERGITPPAQASRDTPAVSSIIPVILGDAGRALAMSQRLEAQGFLVMAIRPPTVPAGTARLRVTFSATQEETQVDALVTALAQAQAA